MGWYKTVISKFSSSYEAKIVKFETERIARRKLYYKGDSSPSQSKIDSITKDVISKLENTYGSLDSIRRASSSESLDSIIEKAVNEILP